MNLNRLYTAIGLILTLLPLGCGGSDPSAFPTPSPTPTSGATGNTLVRTQTELFWIARSRSSLTTLVPASALSVELIVEDQSGRQSRVVVNRHSDPSGYLEKVDFPNALLLGRGRLKANFYAESDAQGSLVALANENIAIPASGTLPGVTAGTRIATVQIPTGQSILALVPQAIVYSIRDKDNNIIALTPGALRWEYGPKSLLTLQADQTFLSSAVGIAWVQLTVDDVSSSATNLAIRSDAMVQATPQAAELTPGGSATFTAQVVNTFGGTTAFRWQVVETGGGQVTSTGLYTAPNKRGTFHLEAISLFDESKRARITIQVKAGSISGVIN